MLDLLNKIKKKVWNKFSGIYPPFQGGSSPLLWVHYIIILRINPSLECKGFRCTISANSHAQLDRKIFGITEVVIWHQQKTHKVLIYLPSEAVGISFR